MAFHNPFRLLRILSKLTFISPLFRASIKRGIPVPRVHFPTGTRKFFQKSFRELNVNFPSLARPSFHSLFKDCVAGSHSFLIFWNIFVNCLSALSTTVSPWARLPKSIPAPPAPPVPVPLPEEGVELVLSVWLSSLFTWSNPMRARIFSAAFWADLATPLFALERLSAELAAASIPVLAPAAALPIAEICPEALLLDF